MSGFKSFSLNNQTNENVFICFDIIFKLSRIMGDRILLLGFFKVKIDGKNN
ncbi:hypothetical protein JCM14036_01560 [Desulfotomaculum defluvii]